MIENNHTRPSGPFQNRRGTLNSQRKYQFYNQLFSELDCWAQKVIEILEISYGLELGSPFYELEISENPPHSKTFHYVEKHILVNHCIRTVRGWRP